jgi:hypothetical protein
MCLPVFHLPQLPAPLILRMRGRPSVLDVGVRRRLPCVPRARGMRPRARERFLRRRVRRRRRRRRRWGRRPSAHGGRALRGRRRRRWGSTHGADGYGRVDGDRDGWGAVLRGRGQDRDWRGRRVGNVGCWNVRDRQEGGIVDRVASGAENRRAARYEARDGRRYGYSSVGRRGDQRRRRRRGLVAAAWAGSDGDRARGVCGRIDHGSAAGDRIRNRAGRHRGVCGGSDCTSGAGRR